MDTVQKASSSNNEIWRYLIGFVIGVLVTLAFTVLVGWLIDSGTPATSWLNKAFYGYALGCSPAFVGSSS